MQAHTQSPFYRLRNQNTVKIWRASCPIPASVCNLSSAIGSLGSLSGSSVSRVLSSKMPTHSQALVLSWSCFCWSHSGFGPSHDPLFSSALGHIDYDQEALPYYEDLWGVPVKIWGTGGGKSVPENVIWITSSWTLLTPDQVHPLPSHHPFFLFFTPPSFRGQFCGLPTCPSVQEKKTAFHFLPWLPLLLPAEVYIEDLTFYPGD